MYLRPAFVETDLDRITSLIRAHPFGVLVTHGAAGMDASHIPFVVERHGDTLVLTGHLAKPNAQCAQLDGGTALAIFSGPHGYISPSWYKTQPSVPTWDYAAVHIHGTLEPMANHTAMLEHLAEGDPGHFTVHDLAERYRDAMFAGIRSFRLPASRIEAQWKMSQNRSVDDRLGVIAALRSQGMDDVAREIEATLPPA
jgi:transcriptional regulator